MMYPRLMFSDNMEDKGMEEARAKNFQRMIVDRLNQIEAQKKKNLEPTHEREKNQTGLSFSEREGGRASAQPGTLNLEPSFQLIFATSNIADELNTPEYTIGDYYTQDNKSLKNV